MTLLYKYSNINTETENIQNYTERSEKDMTVQDFMFQSGIPMNLLGYEYIKEALEIYLKKPEIGIMVMYEEIAKKHDVKSYCVERNIRNAIERGYPMLNEDIKKKIFGSKERVKVSEYIKGISYALRNNLI